MATGTVSFSLWDPSSLFAGCSAFIHRDITYSGSTIILRGTLLGRVTSGGTAGTPTAKSGNTGTVTVTMDSSTPVLSGAEAGTYRIVWTDATHFSVYDPNGDLLGTVLGTAGWNNEIKFAIGTPSPAMVAGDEYDVVITAQDKYVVSKALNTDGSQVPTAIAAIDIDLSSTGSNGADVTGPAYFHGEFAAEKVIAVSDASWTMNGAEAVLRQQNSQLFLKQLGTLG